MNNQKCASIYEMAYLSSLNFQMSQLVYSITIVITFFSTYFAVKIVLFKSIFQTSTKIILIQNILYANLHQIVYLVYSIQRLYIGFFKTEDACIPLQSEEGCSPYFQLFFLGVSGMTYGQTGLLLERAAATFMKNYEKRKSIFVGGSISLLIFILSASTGRIILWDDPLDQYLLVCNSVPSASSDRTTRFHMICTIVSLLNLVIAILIRRINQKLEYATPFVVGPRFRKREVIDSTGTICFLTLFQFIFMFFNSFGISILKTIRNLSLLTYSQYYSIVIWCYTVPFIAMLFPILLIFRIKYSQANRVELIKQFVNTKQTQEEHIKQMKNVWS